MCILDVLNLLSQIATLAALVIAVWTLKITKQSIERARVDWAKQKWFDLYFKADQAYNALDEYQALYKGANPAIPSPKQEADRNTLMNIFRETCTMASVFPINTTTDALFKSVNFTNVVDALSKERLKVLSDALEQLRQKALLNSDVLRVETGNEENTKS